MKLEQLAKVDVSIPMARFILSSTLIARSRTGSGIC